ncbi:CdaR family transcriptional regulator [Amycolatopsis lurida]
MAPPILTPELAQEIAGETSTIIGLNVLITDRDGTVIGSGDPSRIGTVHEASLDVLATLEATTHTTEQARGLRGVLPGITLPIVHDGVAVGTVGLTGPPRRVRQFGLVVRRQTEILLEESILLRSRLLREQALTGLVRDLALFDPDVVDPAAIDARASELGLDLRVSRVVLLVVAEPLRGPAQRTVREVFHGQLDVMAEMAAGRLAVLHHGDAVTAAERLLALLRQRHDLSARIGVGTAATGVAGLHESYVDASEAVRLGERGPGVFPIDRLRTKQLLASTGRHARDRFTTALLGGLPADPQWPVLRETLLAWGDCGFNLVRTATALHVHRNTLLYRLDKLTRLSGRPVREPAEAIALYLACHLTD